MRVRASVAAMSALLFLAGQASAQSTHSVEPNPPNGEGQIPAWPTQTRAPARTSDVRFKVETVAEGLETPWGMAFMPDGRMLVTERPGRIRIVSPDGKLSEPVAGVPEVRIQGISGLMDVALDPAFAENGVIYWTYLENRGGDELSGTTLARGRLVEGPQPRLEEVTVIYRQKPDLKTRFSNYGGRLLFADDGTLFVTLGDRDEVHWRPLIHQTDNGVGKIIRIRTDGSPAPGGPFEGKAGHNAEIYAMGFRNPLGIAFWPGTQEVWATDVGPRGGDELNRVLAGSNQGWPLIGYGHEYTGEPVGSGTAREGLEQPIYYWDPVISPAALMFYTGDLFPAWKGDAFVASLSQKHLVRLEFDADRKVSGEERLLVDLEERLRDVRQGPDGAIYVLTDNAEGRLLRLVPAE